MEIAGKVLWSQIRRHARRIDLWILRGLILLFFIGLLQTPPNADLFSVVLGSGLFIGLFLSGWLAGDILEIRNDQFLDLLRMTRLDPIQWHAVILALAYIKFFWVISVRWPVLVAFWFMGRMTFGEIVLAEFVMTFAFAVYVNVWMFMAFVSGMLHRQLTISALVVPLILDCSVLAVAAIADVLRPFFPPLFEFIVHVLAGCSVVYVWTERGGGPGSFLWLTALFYLAISAFFLLALQGQFRLGWFTEWINFEESPASEMSKEFESPVRGEVWDDALAWQSSHLYGKGRMVIKWKGIAYVFVLFFAALLWLREEREYAVMLLSGSSVIASAMAVQHVSNCVTQEAKQRTLPSLILAIGDEDRLIPGWRRGAMWLAIPDFSLVFTASALISIWNLDVGIGLLGLCWAILMGSPLFIVSSLLPQNFGGFVVGMLIAFFVVVLAGVAIGIGTLTSSGLAFAITAVSISMFFNQLLKETVLPEWFDRTVSDVS